MTKTFTVREYVMGLLVVFVCSYSQYVIPRSNFITGAFIVYGISIIIISANSGRVILKSAFNNTASAIRLGTGLFGIFVLLSTAASFAIMALLLNFDPSAVRQLHRPVPVLNVPPHLAWVMVFFSITFVGPAEEYIFRGFVFGGLLRLTQGRHWLMAAIISSALFAAVHLYYALAYGVASLIPFVDIFAIGMALAITYYRSRGNLLAPALLHGVFDATGFLSIAVSSELGLSLRGLLVLTGIIVALTFFKHPEPNPLPGYWTD